MNYYRPSRDLPTHKRARAEHDASFVRRPLAPVLNQSSTRRARRAYAKRTGSKFETHAPRDITAAQVAHHLADVYKP
jgi:hypothetical protein